MAEKQRNAAKFQRFFNSHVLKFPEVELEVLLLLYYFRNLFTYLWLNLLSFTLHCLNLIDLKTVKYHFVQRKIASLFKKILITFVEREVLFNSLYYHVSTTCTFPLSNCIKNPCICVPGQLFPKTTITTAQRDFLISKFRILPSTSKMQSLNGSNISIVDPYSMSFFG